MRAFLRLPLALLLTGCLTSTHIVPRGELQRLAAMPPEERGREVRVIQGFANSEAPPGAPRVGVGTAVIIAPDPYVPGPAYAPGRASVKNLKEQSKVWLVLAAVTAIGLAVTEGLRFDGWVQLDPRHPIHLWMADGQWTWVPLDQLDAGTAAYAVKAFVREEEGPWLRLRRAPLDREGFTYSLLMGTGEVTAFDDARRAGFLSHIEFGYHPLNMVGILFDIGLGWRTDRDFSDIFQSRYALEVQVLPLDLGILHAGGYGEVGMAYSFEDFPDGYGDDRRKMMAGGGAILQLELTTRLALTAKLGVAALGGDRVAEATFGVSIY